MRKLTWLMGLVAFAQLAACGGNGSSGSGTCSNIAGTWSSVEVVDSSACGEGTQTQNKTYVIAQSGCDITLTTSGLVFQGSINGSHLSWSGSYSEGTGTVTITGMSVTLSSDLGTASGTANWTWTGSGSSCNGTTQITATKSASALSGMNAGVSG